MRISFYTVDGNLDITNGYGNAMFQFIRALQARGHEVPFDDETAPVQISFCQPTHYKFHEGQFKIGYTPWESTELPDGWLEKMNACDEIWATSEWVKGVYEKAGVKVPIFVVHHGLDEIWKPVKRVVEDKVHFFHHGEPALRKGGQMTLDAFRRVFKDNSNVHLTFKANSQHYLRTWQDGVFKLPEYNNVSVITTLYHPSELVELYNKMHVMVYPSYGEGFGLIPLQAMGTGMPVIGTADWAPYGHHIRNVNLGLNYTMNRSLWSVHPGDVMYPSFDDLCGKMAWIYENAGLMFDRFTKVSDMVHSEFKWDKIAGEVEIHLKKVLTNS